MTDIFVSSSPTLAMTTPPQAAFIAGATRPEAVQRWLQALYDMTDDAGSLEPAGNGHHLLHIDAGPRLLVCFEQLPRMMTRAPGVLPPAWAAAVASGASVLGVISEAPGWYRAPALWQAFDQRTDEGFFEQFDDTLFYGAGPGGYAACCYAAAAPGCDVLALAPVATLDPEIAGWDRRWAADRRMDFRSRYGYGPDMVRAARRVSLIHDPEIAEDAMHAALYRQTFVQRLAARGAGAEPEAVFEDSGILPDLIALAFAGSLNAQSWAQLWRQRRQAQGWLQSRAERLGAHPRRARVLLAEALRLNPDQPDLRQRLDQISAL